LEAKATLVLSAMPAVSTASMTRPALASISANALWILRPIRHDKLRGMGPIG